MLVQTHAHMVKHMHKTTLDNVHQHPLACYKNIGVRWAAGDFKYYNNNKNVLLTV